MDPIPQARAALGLLLLCAALAGCGGQAPPKTPPPDDADLVVRPIEDERFEGTVFYEFDASEALAGKDVETYLWRFGDLEAGSWTDVVRRGYGRAGTYEAAITATLVSGGTVQAQATFEVDDLPHDYWGDRPQMVNTTQAGAMAPIGFGVHFDVSADGRRVAFTAGGDDLSPLDTNGQRDVYVKDMDSGEVMLVSAGAGGVAEGGNGPVAISGDGAVVAYRAPDGTARVVQLATATSVSVPDPSGVLDAIPEDLSYDGSRLAFRTHKTNNPTWGGYVIDLGASEVTRLAALIGGDYGRVSRVSISADGGVAVFQSSTDGIVPEDANGETDVFAYDMSTGETKLVSSDLAGTPGNGPSEAVGPIVSGDGRHVTFYSETTNFPDATDNDSEFSDEITEDVYVKDLQTGELTLVSVNDLGAAADSDSILPTISDDGRYVAFGSYAENLAPHMDDLDDCFFDLCVGGFSFVKDLRTGRVQMVTVALGDTLPDDWDQIEPRISGDGRYVVFYSWASNLTPESVGDELSLYRAPNPLWTGEVN